MEIAWNLQYFAQPFASLSLVFYRCEYAATFSMVVHF